MSKYVGVLSLSGACDTGEDAENDDNDGDDDDDKRGAGGSKSPAEHRGAEVPTTLWGVGVELALLPVAFEKGS